MKADKMEVLKFLSMPGKTFVIPVYQRNYNWQRKQCEKLFNDIENIIKNNYEISHFIGTVVYVEGNKGYEFEDCVVVDGQQRITTITLLLKAIVDTIDKMDKKIIDKITEHYLIHKYKDDENSRLILCKDDLKNWENILNNKLDYVDKNSAIYLNYIIFKNLLINSEFSCLEILNALNKLELVYIMLEKTENPQLIFESLNSTGLSLTQGDLIRNYLLMNHEYKKQKRLYLNYWYKMEKRIGNLEISNFISDYISMKTGKKTKEDDLYNSFKLFKDKKVREEPNLDEEYFLEELLVYSEYYEWFIKQNCPYTSINNLLENINTLKYTVVYPTLLYLFEERFQYDNISMEELESLLNIIVTYLVRRKICDYKSNELKSIFCNIPSKFDNAKGSTYKEKLMNMLIRNINNSSFPKNKEFRQCFIKYNIYKDSKLCKYILFEIEKFKNNKEIISNISEIQIEHIMPQKLTSSWQINLGKDAEQIHNEYLNTIGNLSLTGYNANLSNKNFSDKKDYFEKSNFTMTRELCKFENWDKTNIEIRAKQFSKIAEQIWFLDEKYNKDYEKADTNLDYFLSDEINITDTKPKSITIDDNIYFVNSWKDFLRNLCHYFYNLNRDIFRNFIDDKDFYGTTRKLVDYHYDNMNSPFELESNLFIETNLSANSILSFSRLIAEKYEYIDKISFNLRN